MKNKLMRYFKYKAEKNRVLLVNVFFCLTIKKFLSELKEKENKYYIIFVLQNSKFGKSANHRIDIHMTFNEGFITNEYWCIRIEKPYAAPAQKWPWICKSLGLKVQLLYIQPTSRFHGKKVGNYLI